MRDRRSDDLGDHVISAANADAADTPAIAVPETLTLPEAVTVITGASHISRAAVISVTGPVARTIVPRACSDRAAEQGSANQTCSNGSTAATATPMLRAG